MTNEEALKAFEMRLNGYTFQQIANELHYTHQHVSNFLQNAVKDRKKSEASPKSVYPNLSSLIKEKYGTMSKFCEVNDIKYKHFCDVMRGILDPRSEDIFKCCEVLGYDCLFLFEKKDNKNQQPADYKCKDGDTE